MKPFHYLLATCYLLLGCNDSKPGVSTKWYDPWIADQLALGADFHSEFALHPGGLHAITIMADVPCEVGFVVKNGYEVAKSEGTIYLGTDDQPRSNGGSPGVRSSFTPVDGRIVLRFENSSPVDTRLAVYIKKGEQIADPNRSLPPTFNPTSSNQRSED